ncbi:hypothetical protein G6653_00020 [Polynucleobacter paneuropaeus]|jgi:hypothetical protein|nr:hypothetical protein [Polynucleobacter paneuropaeus]MBT8610200.1 hypothetical protein [Polynucleobacter paneuropaeus]
MTTNTGNKQLAVRLEKEVLVAIDKKRMEIAQVEGIIPTRSDIVRAALGSYLGIKMIN